MDKWFKEDSNKKNVYFNKSNIFRTISLTNWIIILNILIYILVSVLIYFIGEQKVLYWFALSPNVLFSGAIWQLFTSFFTHIWFPHLLFNMISLFFIGNFVEKIIGRKRFLRFYLVAGVFAGLFFAILSFWFGSGIGEKIFLSPSEYSVGASGALFALLGILAILTPYSKVYLIAGPLIAIIIQSFLSYFYPNLTFLSVFNVLITFYFIASIFSIFSFNSTIRKIAIPIEMPIWLLPIVAIIPLIIIGLILPLPIGNMAHLGGLLVGLAYGLYIKKKYKRKSLMISRYFLK